MLCNCPRCGKEIYIPDGWYVSSNCWEETLCNECQKEKNDSKNTDKTTNF